MIEILRRCPQWKKENMQVCACFNRHTSTVTPSELCIYESITLSICLYGCERWCLKETLFAELREFHARCVRTLSRTN
jgi:hypothetical protein